MFRGVGVLGSISWLGVEGSGGKGFGFPGSGSTVLGVPIIGIMVC